MKYFELFSVALQSMLVNKARSLLTMLGIIIGVGSVIAVVAIGQGAQHNVAEQISSLGTNVLIIFPGSSHRGGASRGAGSFNRMTEADVKTIAERATSVQAVTPLSRTGGQVIYGNNNWSTSIYGVYTDYMYIRDWSIAEGTMFSEQHNRSGAKVCVIGKTVADELFPGIDPVDKIIRIRKMPFKVLGVLKERGQSLSGSDQDDIILAPFTTVQRKMSGSQYVNTILVSARSEAEIEVAKAEISEILRVRMRVGPTDSDPFTVRTQTDIAEAAKATSNVFTSLLYSVAAVSLLVGGIGIMNIMLVSVTERTREIGIRRAIGARQRDILLQFLIEACILSAAGGSVGIGVGIGGANVISSLQGWPTLIAPEAVVLALAVSIVVGVFFGFYPAQKASRLDPIEALRHE